MRPLVFIVILFAYMYAYADSPSAPPSRYEITSPNKAYVAVSDPKTGTTILDTSTRTIRWTIPEWQRAVFLSNDGVHAVTEYGGLNLIPDDYSEDLVLVTFWESGRIIKKLTVKDIIQGRKIMQQTMSHFAWGNIRGIDEQNELVIVLINDEILRFDMATGTRK